MADYVKIDRKMLDWEWYRNINTKVLFLHMLLKANWKEGRFENKVVPRGSFVSSVKKLSEETDLTEREIRTAISHLKTTGEVTSKSYPKYTVFTVKNYDKYQTTDKQNDKQVTSKRQTNDKRTTTIEERKKERKEEDIPPISPATRFDDFWTAYPKQVKQEQAKTAYCKTLLSDVCMTEDTLITAAANYGEACRLLGTEDRYIKNPDRWLLDNAFVDYLEGRYKKPQAKSKGSKFNQFQQHDYDFDALERDLIEN